MESNGSILFSDIEETYVPLLKKTFTDNDIQVFESHGLETSKEILEKHPIDMVLTDFGSAPGDAMSLLTFVREHRPEIFRIAILGSEEQKRAI
jgi:DNA-binding NtrC family response regulator